MLKNRSIFLSLIFIMVAFFSSSVIHSIEIASEANKEENSFMSSCSIGYNVASLNKDISDKDYDIYKHEILNLPGKYIMLTNDGKYKTYGIYFNKNIKNIPTILKGRFFKVSDFNKNKKYVVIGETFKENTIKIHGNDYYCINGEKYKVIGIMGNTKRESSYSYSVFYNLDGYLNSPSNKINLKYFIDASNSETYKSMKNNLSKDFNVQNMTKSSMMGEDYFMEDVKSSMEIIFKIVIVFILSAALVTEYWIKNRKKEIGIKRALGATRIRISLEIIGELISLSFISYIIGYLSYLLFYLIKDKCVSFYFSSAIIVFLITLLSSLLVSFIPIKESLKVQPREIMR